MSRRFFVIGFLFALAITLAALPALAAPPLQEPAPPPANDSFDQAALIDPFPFYGGSFALANATVETGEPIPNCAWQETFSSVWFKLQAASTEDLRVSLAPAGMMILSVYRDTGNGIAALEEVACFDTLVMGPPGWFSTVFPAVADQTYFVRVATFAPATNESFHLRLDPASTPVIDFSMDPMEGNVPTGGLVWFYASTGGLDVTTWEWDFADGTTSPDGGMTSHIFQAPGEYWVRLTVTTTEGATAYVTHLVTVTDPPPSSVWFEAWPSNPVVGQSVAFVPMSQGQVDSYEFNYGDGSPPVSGTWMDYFEHAFATAGEYRVQLTGYAGVAPVATFTSPLVVTEAPPAEVWFSYDPPSPTPCNVVSFWPSGTGVASYSFDYGDGAIQSGSPWDWFGHQYADSGSYEVTLYGLDDFGEQVASTLQSIQVNAGPSFSTWFWNYPEAPNRLQPVSFYSYLDPWGACVKSWSWDFGDGTTGSGSYAEHLYAADGTYHVVLTVEGYGGQSAQFEQDVTVKTIDVRISRFGVPKSATVGQQRTIVVGITNRTYPVGVAVVLYKRGAFGEEFVGELHQLVRVQNRATEFAFNYTFTPQDAELGKVTFVARAYLESPYYDALPLDNEAVSLAVTVLKGKPAQATTADLEMLETFEFAEPLRFLYLPVIQE